jgi:hypothetical protein
MGKHAAKPPTTEETSLPAVPRAEYIFALQPHAIFCNACKDIVLTEDEYHEQCNSLNDEWTCPICLHKAFYNQDSEDEFFKQERAILKAEYSSEGDR